MKLECKYICQHCGNTAFYVKSRKFIEIGEVIRASSFQLLDGSEPKSGDKIICGSCKKELPNLSVFQIVSNES